MGRLSNKLVSLAHFFFSFHHQLAARGVHFNIISIRLEKCFKIVCIVSIQLLLHQVDWTVFYQGIGPELFALC